MILAVIGVVVGLAGSIELSGLMAKLLFGVSPADPGTLVVVSALLIGVAVLAGYIPARRAARVDPLVALRHE